MMACQRHLLTCSVTALVQPDGMGMQLPSLSREEFMPLINTVSHFGHLRSQVPLFTWPTTSICAARQQMSFWLPSTATCTQLWAQGPPNVQRATEKQTRELTSTW